MKSGVLKFILQMKDLVRYRQLVLKHFILSVFICDFVIELFLVKNIADIVTFCYVNNEN